MCPGVTEDFDLFCESFLTAIDSEKDPRNLMTIFDTINCMSKMPLSLDYVEEFFESIFCYFPITFRSNPSDPNLITVEDLKGSLRRAISGDSRFGDLAVPVLIEKLSLNSVSAKMDSLDVLIKATSTYDPISFSQFSYQLEVAIFSEITGNPDPKIQTKALQLVRLLSSVLPEESVDSWRSKFLNESVRAVELDSREIMSKSAVMIEAVSSSSEYSFNQALKNYANVLLKIAQEESFSVKSQAARNSLVALFSPIKNNSCWIELVPMCPEVVLGLENLFISVNCEIGSYGVYLVLFSFISRILSKPCVDAFITKFLSVCKEEFNLSNELKNCIWLASKSYPEAFVDHLATLENDEIISASASTANLAKCSLERLIELDRISAIEEVLMKSDLSEVSYDLKMIKTLLSLPINSVSIIKLFSILDSNSQIIFIQERLKIETILIGSRPEAIEACKDVLSQCNSDFNDPRAVTSLFNKCPKMFSSEIFINNPELFLASIKGLIYRMDARALQLIETNLERFPVIFYSKMFSVDTNQFFTSEETFHVKKALHLQWILNFVLNHIIKVKGESSINSLALLLSILTISPPHLIQINSSVLFDLILNFLILSNSSNGVDLDSKIEAWGVFVTLLENSKDIKVDEIIHLALKHVSIKNESSSKIRFSSLKILSKLIEIPSLRCKCFNHQISVLLALKSSDSLNDPKRVVRQEAARANNLWHILNEEGVFE